MVGIGDGDNHFTNGLTRVVVEKGAEVDHTYVCDARAFVGAGGTVLQE